MTDAPRDRDPLEPDFLALKARSTQPGEDLMARVLADADAAQVAMSAPRLTPRLAPRDPLSARFFAVIGGWPSMVGLATAGLAGVWIGVAQPAALVAGSEALIYGDATVTLVDLDAGFGLGELDGDL